MDTSTATSTFDGSNNNDHIRSHAGSKSIDFGSNKLMPTHSWEVPRDSCENPPAPSSRKTSSCGCWRRGRRRRRGPGSGSRNGQSGVRCIIVVARCALSRWRSLRERRLVALDSFCTIWQLGVDTCVSYCGSPRCAVVGVRVGAHCTLLNDAYTGTWKHWRMGASPKRVTTDHFGEMRNVASPQGRELLRGCSSY